MQFQQDCPLCGAPAHFESLDFGRRKHFKCPSCTEFVIWHDAEQAIDKWALTTLQRCSEGARATTDPTHIFAITGWTPGQPPHIEMQVGPQLRSKALAR